MLPGYLKIKKVSDKYELGGNVAVDFHNVRGNGTHARLIVTAAMRSIDAIVPTVVDWGESLGADREALAARAATPRRSSL